jgi:hypothetical protein
VARPAKNSTVVIEQEVNLPSSTIDTKVLAQALIPQEVFTQYQSEASEKKIPTTELMGNRLSACKDHLDPQGLFFGGLMRQELESLLRDNLPMEEDALKKIKEALSVCVEGVYVQLSVPQVRRLEMGLRRNQSISDRITDIVQRAVTAATGVR